MYFINDYHQSVLQTDMTVEHNGFTLHSDAEALQISLMEILKQIRTTNTSFSADRSVLLAEIQTILNLADKIMTGNIPDIWDELFDKNSELVTFKELAISYTHEINIPASDSHKFALRLQTYQYCNGENAAGEYRCINHHAENNELFLNILLTDDNIKPNDTLFPNPLYLHPLTSKQVENMPADVPGTIYNIEYKGLYLYLGYLAPAIFTPDEICSGSAYHYYLRLTSKVFKIASIYADLKNFIKTYIEYFGFADLECFRDCTSISAVSVYQPLLPPETDAFTVANMTYIPVSCHDFYLYEKPETEDADSGIYLIEKDVWDAVKQPRGISDNRIYHRIMTDHIQNHHLNYTHKANLLTLNIKCNSDYDRDALCNRLQTLIRKVYPDATVTFLKMPVDADIKTESFDVSIQPKICINSLLFPSDTVIASITMSTDAVTAQMDLMIRGDVHLYWHGTDYHHVKDFPSDLIDAIKYHTYASDPECDVINNNWFEFIYDIRDNSNGQSVAADGIMADDLDLPKITKNELQRHMHDLLHNLIKSI